MIVVRRGGPDDAPAIASVMARGFAGYRAFAPDDWVPGERGSPANVARTRERLAAPGAWAAVAEADGAVVGVSAFEPSAAEDGEAYLMFCFVDEPYRGSGLASRLLAEAVVAAAAAGLTQMRLTTPAQQARARRFYAREGWAQDGDPWFDPRFGMDVVTYRRTAP